ncbi:Cu-binding protein [Coemansia sp. RSA 552]|nr:Cu-binding protein [Coemansia sp. RSA 552]
MRVLGSLLRASRPVGTRLALGQMPRAHTGRAMMALSGNRAYSSDGPQEPKAVPKAEPKAELKTELKTEPKAKPEKEAPKQDAPKRTPTPGGEPKPKDRWFPRVGPLSPIGIALFVASSAGILYYFTTEKERVKVQRAKSREEQRGGKADVGGPFELIDQDGKTVTDETFKGKFVLYYFGFCHCPDICPDELDKIGEALDLLDRSPATKDLVQPVFITCDPQRDSPEAVKEYLKQFHPKFVGLTGSIDQVRNTCKAYRVYFSKPPKVEEGQDYLVDHSIFSYFMDPDGEFVDVYGKDKSALFMAGDIDRCIQKFRDSGRKI